MTHQRRRRGSSDTLLRSSATLSKQNYQRTAVKESRGTHGGLIHPRFLGDGLVLRAIVVSLGQRERGASQNPDARQLEIGGRRLDTCFVLDRPANG